MDELTRQHLSRFRQLSDQLIDEVVAREGAQPVRSTTWPTVSDIAAHVATIYRWVSAVISSGGAAERREQPLAEPALELRQARDELLELLQADDADCWTIGGSTGTTAFWRRRMVLETMKHLLDVRTPPEGRFAIPTELDLELAVDGIDEFFTVFLARSRPTLASLPGSVRLNATDAGRSWRLLPEWHIDDGAEADAVVDADAAAVLLMLWERADALDEPDRFTVTGDEGVVQKLMNSPIHR